MCGGLEGSCPWLAESLASVPGVAESLVEEEGEGKAESLPATPVFKGASSGSAGITQTAGRRGEGCVWCVWCVYGPSQYRK
jgi:hypothetical protein